MDRQTIVVLGGFFVIMMGSAAVNNLTTDPFLRAYAFPIFMGVFVAFIVGQDLMYRLAAAEYLCIRMTIRPSGEVLWLWAKTIEPFENKEGFATVVKLAHPTKELAPYGRLRTLIINSKLHPNRAIKWGPGEVWYKETQIKHGRYTQITVDQQEKGASNLERGFSEPVFYLRESTNYVKEGSIVVADSTDITKSAPYQAMEDALAQKTYEAENNHKRALVAEEMVTKLQGELQSRIAMDFNVNDLALIKITTLIHLLEDFNKVANALGRRTTATYIKWLVPGLIAALVFLFFYTQPQMWSKLELWIANPLNQFYALLIVGVVATAGFLILRHRRNSP